MANLPPGTPVDLTEFAAEMLRFGPPDGDLVIVVHPAALRAPRDAHTQVAQVVHGRLTWLGALAEDLLVTLDAPPEEDARAACAEAFLIGARLWEVVRPGSLLAPDAPPSASGVYRGSVERPWVVVGATDDGDLVAAPLTDAANPKWWAPVLPRTSLSFPGNIKDSQVELAHVWSLPRSIPSIGQVLPVGHAAIERAILAYVSA